MLRKRSFIGVTVLVLFVIGALLVLWHNNYKSAAANPAPTAMVGPSAAASPVSTSTANPAPMDAAPAFGPKNAPVTIVEYSDFGCPSCVFWYKLGVLDQLRQKYGDQIRFVWRDYPVITLLSPDAAEAGQCANEQGKFWEFHDAVFEHDGNIQASDLKSYATAVGLNMSQFNECVSSHHYRSRVNAEQQEAFGYGYNGAPFFILNDKWIIHGAQQLPVFTKVIDSLLAAPN